jgi:hypothetical protein
VVVNQLERVPGESMLESWGFRGIFCSRRARIKVLQVAGQVVSRPSRGERAPDGRGRPSSGREKGSGGCRDSERASERRAEQSGWGERGQRTKKGR